MALAVLAASVAVVTPATVEADEPVRVAILFGQPKSYQNSAAALEETLTGRGYRCIPIELPGRKDEAGRAAARDALLQSNPTVIATAGGGATSFALTEKHTARP